MKSTLFLLVMVCLMSVGSHSSADIFDHFDLSYANNLGEEREVGAIFRVGGYANSGEKPAESKYSKEYSYFYAKFDLEVGVNESGEIEFADVTFVPYSKANIDNKFGQTLDFAQIRYAKDTAIDMEEHLSVSVVEINFDYASSLNRSGLNLVFEGVLDLFGWAYSESAQTGASESGYHNSFSASVALQSQKFRIAIGGSMRNVIGRREQIGSTEICDDDGTCRNIAKLHIPTRSWSEVYAETKYMLSENLAVTMEANYSVYHVSDPNDPESNVEDDVIRFFFGLRYIMNKDNPAKHLRPWEALR